MVPRILIFGSYFPFIPPVEHLTSLPVHVICPIAELRVDRGSSGNDSKIFAWFNEGNIIPL